MALIDFKFFSEKLQVCTEVYIIMPQKSTVGQIGIDSEASNEKYKCMYLLHGLSDDHTFWLRRTAIERYAAEHGICVVMPAAGRSFYTDMKYGGAYYSYISEELPRLMKEFFNISDKRGDTYIAGLSMGGYGAWKMALGTERFGAGASLSGVLDIVDSYQSHCDETDIRKVEMEGIFGSLEQLKGSDNDITALLKKRVDEKKDLPRLYGWCGTSDDLYENGKPVWQLAKDLGYDVTTEESEGDNQWKYWDAKIQDVLRWWLGEEILF